MLWSMYGNNHISADRKLAIAFLDTYIQQKSSLLWRKIFLNKMLICNMPYVTHLTNGLYV